MVTKLKFVLFAVMVTIPALTVILLQAWVLNDTYQREVQIVRKKHFLIAHNLSGVLDRRNLPDYLFNCCKNNIALCVQAFSILFIVFVIYRAKFRRNRKARQHWQTERRHLSKIGPFATKKIAHINTTFGRTIAKIIYPLRVLGGSISPLLD